MFWKNTCDRILLSLFYFYSQTWIEISARLQLTCVSRVFKFNSVWLFPSCWIWAKLKYDGWILYDRRFWSCELVFCDFCNSSRWFLLAAATSGVSCIVCNPSFGGCGKLLALTLNPFWSSAVYETVCKIPFASM